MFIRSMDSDYQVLSVLQKNEYYADYHCRKLPGGQGKQTDCYLHLFQMDAVDEKSKEFLLELAAKKKPVDLVTAFLWGDYLCLEFPVKAGTDVNDALAAMAVDVSTPSLQEKLSGVVAPDTSLTESIALSKHLMEICLSRRLPTGILYEVLDLRNLLCIDGQFDFCYEFREPDRLASDRLRDVCSRLAQLNRLLFGNNLRSKAAEGLAAWVAMLDDPKSDIQKLTDIYPSFYDAIEALENSSEEDRVIISEFRKKLDKVMALVKHILSPVPLEEKDYVIIGNYHVFTKFLILGGAAAVAAAFELGKIMHFW